MNNGTPTLDWSQRLKGVEAQPKHLKSLKIFPQIKVFSPFGDVTVGFSIIRFFKVNKNKLKEEYLKIKFEKKNENSIIFLNKQWHFKGVNVLIFNRFS